MTKDLNDEEFLVQHLVDPTDWVADHERSLCHVCSRGFGTFRRKHHCRMCGEIVCSGCTLHKNALLATIGYTRVRVCISCLFNHDATQKVRGLHSPLNSSPTTVTTITSNGSREWLTSHLHSPMSSSDQVLSPSSDDDNSAHPTNNQSTHTSNPSTTPTTNQIARSSGSSSNNQDTNEEGSPLRSCSSPPSWTHPWPQPPVPQDESLRLAAVHALHVLDSAPEKSFDMLCDLAKARLACPMAAVSFLDAHRQWFKASVGLAHKMIPRKIAFCAYTVQAREPVVILDTLNDPRFACNPLVSGAAAVRFYAAAPILDHATGHAVGSVFVLDTRPRESCDVEMLERLARTASDNLTRRCTEQATAAAPATVATPTEKEEEEQQQEEKEEEQEQEVKQLIQQQSDMVEATQKLVHASQPSSPTSSFSPSASASTASSSSSPVMSAPRAHSRTDAELPVTPAPVVSLPLVRRGQGRSSNGSSSHAVVSAASSGSTDLATRLKTPTSVADGQPMEVLLMKLLTQNTETQQQLANQQVSLNSTLNEHSEQISQLMTNVARMEAKIESRIKTT